MKSNKYLTHRKRKVIENCKKNKPWEHTTGPKTDDGKSTSAQNALKHGGRSQSMRDLEKILSLHNQFLKSIRYPEEIKPMRHPELVSGSISTILESEINSE